jgi:hypothetical protein
MEQHDRIAAWLENWNLGEVFSVEMIWNLVSHLGASPPMEAEFRKLVEAERGPFGRVAVDEEGSPGMIRLDELKELSPEATEKIKERWKNRLKNR